MDRQVYRWHNISRTRDVMERLAAATVAIIEKESGSDQGTTVRKSRQPPIMHAPRSRSAHADANDLRTDKDRFLGAVPRRSASPELLTMPNVLPNILSVSL